LKTKKDTKRQNQSSSRQAKQDKLSACIKTSEIIIQPFKLPVSMNLKPETEFSSIKPEVLLKRENIQKLKLHLLMPESPN